MTRRLASPLRLLADGTLATIEQGSDADINQCLRGILRTRIGDRPDLPAMGFEDPTFGEQPLELDAAREVVGRYEPRVSSTLRTAPDVLDAQIADIVDEWSPQANTDRQD